MNFATHTKIGVIGGVSWHSTALYYRHINVLYQQRKGKQHSAPLLLNSLDFQWVLDGYKKKSKFLPRLKQHLRFLDYANCSPMLIASNTVHDAFDFLQNAFPKSHWLHIADCVEHHCKEKGFERIGILGTKYTMRNSFYRSRFSNIETIIPTKHIAHLDQIIGELVTGKSTPQSQQKLVEIAGSLQTEGAQAVALACTELPLLLQQEDCEVPLIDTAYLHCQMGVDMYLEQTNRRS